MIMKDNSKNENITSVETRLSLQYSIVRILAESNGIGDTLLKILQTACEYNGWGIGEIWFIDEDTGVLRLDRMWHHPSWDTRKFEAVSRGIAFQPGQGLPGRVWESGQPQWITNVIGDPNFVRESIASEMGLHTAFAFPIKRSGEVMGVFAFFSRDIEPHDDALLEMFAAIGNQVGGFIKRKEAEKALKESEKRFRDIFDEAPDGILIADPETNGFYLGNRAICNMLGYTEEEIRRLTVMDIHPEKDLPYVLELFGKMARGELKVARNVPFKRRDGSVFYSDINTFWLTISGKRYLAGIFRDVTDRIGMEKEVERANRLESIGILAGGIAHDYNNLMTAVMGNISLAKMKTSPDNKTHKWLTEAEKACEQTRELSNRLIVFAEGGESVRETTSISGIITKTVNKLLKGSSIRSDITLSDNLYLVEINKDQIMQAFINLIVNAMESMPDGGVLGVKAANITVSDRDNLPLREGDYLKVSISDTGRGIPEEDLPKIFDPYFTTKEMGSVKGTGLGLSVCYSIVKNHGGFIDVESEVGTETTFNVYLPASEKQNINREKRAAAAKRILVMDDEAVVRKVACDILGEFGFEVETAMDGLEAVDIYMKAKESGRPFDAVLLDLSVAEGVGGDVAIRKLQAIDPGVKGIVMSGYAKDRVLTDYENYGFAAAIAKPFDFKLLKEVVEGVLRK